MFTDWCSLGFNRKGWLRVFKAWGCAWQIAELKRHRFYCALTNPAKPTPAEENSSSSKKLQNLKNYALANYNWCNLPARYSKLIFPSLCSYSSLASIGSQCEPHILRCTPNTRLSASLASNPLQFRFFLLKWTALPSHPSSSLSFQWKPTVQISYKLGRITMLANRVSLEQHSSEVYETRSPSGWHFLTKAPPR